MRLSLKMLTTIICLSGTVLTTIGCNEYRPIIDDPEAQHPYSANIGNQVEVRKNIQFADIPAPMDFALEKKATKTFQGSSMRFGTLEYRGNWNVWETNQWYLNNMATAGWKLINTKFKDDYNVKSYFKKLDELVAVQIADNYDGYTVVKIWLNDDEQAIQLKEKLLEQGTVVE